MSNNNKNDSQAWCPPGRTPMLKNGQCYCNYSQYSVKSRCLPEAPPCFVPDLDNGYTYYGQNTGGYITHGRRRIES